jgi:uncharacterized iron-regulated membrane protein
VNAEARATYAGSGPAAAVDLARLADLAPAARRIEWKRAAGRPFLHVEAASGGGLDLDPATLEPFVADQAAIRARVARLVPGATIASIEVLTAPDAYWYAVNDEVPLPVWRVKFDDRAGTWVHLNPLTGELLGSLDARGRAYRWLYDGLHRLDFGPLLGHPPARDIVIWLLSIAGLVISVTSIWIAWKRLRRTARKDCRPTRSKAA